MLLKFFKKLSASRFVDILILIVLSIIVHRGWFKPGMLDCGDLWAMPREALVKLFSVPYIWFSFSPSYYCPEYASLCQYFPNIFVYPVLQLLPSLAAKIGFDSGNCLRITFFFPYLFLSMFSVYYFTYTLFKKRIICFFATLFFLFNSITLACLSGGVPILAIANVLALLILAFFIKGLQRDYLKNGILTGIFLSLSIAYLPPSAYLTVWAILIFFIGALITEVKNYTRSKKSDRIFNLFRYLILVFIVPVVLHFYWILPNLLTNNQLIPSYPGHDQVGWVHALSYGKLYHTISHYGLGWPPQSPTFPKIPWPYFIIPLLVLIGIVSGFKNRDVRLLTIIAIIGVFFSKGDNKPFGDVYLWFFQYIPGGRMFRVPGKFYCLVNLTYAPLLGVGVNYLADILAKIGDRKRLFFRKGFLKPIFIIFIFCFIIYLVFPAILGELGGTFEAKQIPEQYKIIKEFIQNQPANSFRTYWYPMRGRYAFFSQEYPIISAYYLIGNIGYFLAETRNPEVFKQTNYISKIFGLLNIKYCFLPIENELLFCGRNSYLEVLSHQVGLKRIKIEGDVDVFENQYFLPRFFAADKSTLIVGGLKALALLTSLEGLDFSRCAMFFADQIKDSFPDLLEHVRTVVFYGRDVNDLALSSLGKKYRFELTRHVSQLIDDDVPGRWIKTSKLFYLVQSYDGAIVQNPNGIIYRHRMSKPSKLSTPISIDIKIGNTYEIWLRAFKGTDTGKLSVEIFKKSGILNFNKETLFEIDLKDRRDSFRWIKIATVYLDKGRHYFQIVHDGSYAGMVDQFVVVSKEVMETSRQNIRMNLRGKDIILIENPSGSAISIPVPVEGEYRLAANIDTYNFSGKLILKLNGKNIELKNLNRKNNNFWVDGDTAVNLKEGKVDITMAQEGLGRIKLKTVMLYRTIIPISSVSELFKGGKAAFVAWNMINPTKYKVKLKTEWPAYLIFSEGFDRNWRLNLKKPVSSVCAYGVINSFFIPQGNEIEAILEFTPQRYMYMGLWVSVIGIVFISFYLLYEVINLLKYRYHNKKF